MERLRRRDRQKIRQKFKASGKQGPQTWLTEANADSLSGSVGSDDAETHRLITNEGFTSMWWKREAKSKDWILDLEEQRFGDFSIARNIM